MAVDGRFPEKARILVAPLDWGLGHATRCIPVIRELLALRAEVFLAADGAIATLLEGEFPGLTCLSLPGYRVKYAGSGWKLPLKMLGQAPRILQAIRQERKWLKGVVAKFGINGVISDNRYGLHHPDIPCVFMTHQLTIRAGNVFIERLLRSFNFRFINHFTECWVPDEPGEMNYAGSLSHPPVMPSVPVRYTGILSRLHPVPAMVVPNHLFVSISGPEPQRSLFENRLIDQLSHYNFTATVVRGLPGEQRMLPSTNNLRFFNHLPAGELEKEMAKADLVISRSGYSTVMDLARMGKKSILIPTPGQTEQLYLATYLQGKGFALAGKQENFELEALLDKALAFFAKDGMSSGGLSAGPGHIRLGANTGVNDKLPLLVERFVQQVMNK